MQLCQHVCDPDSVTARRAGLSRDLGTWLRLPVVLQMFDERALDFQEKILDRSGLGDDTYLPDGECWTLLPLLMSRSDVCTGAMHEPCQYA